MAKLSVATLMKLDRDKVMEVPTAEIKADHISKLLGEDQYITIEALSGDKYMDLISTARNKKNELEPSKMYRAQALIVVDGIKEPSLKNEELQQHFGASSAIDLAKILFPGGELVDVFTEIATLSGFIDADDDGIEEEVKN